MTLRRSTSMARKRPVKRRTLGVVALAGAFVASIFAANWLTVRYGFIPVGFGYVATAGTYAAGLTLCLRDWTHERLGRGPTAALIVAGAGVTYFISPAFALASGTAFLVSELADFAVYSPLRRRGLVKALLASNAVGMTVDTVLFLYLAFGWATVAGAWQGQIIGKTWVTLAAAGAIVAYRQAGRTRALLVGGCP